MYQFLSFVVMCLLAILLSIAGVTGEQYWLACALICVLDITSFLGNNQPN